MGNCKIGPGENAVKSTPTMTAATVNRANYRQRAQGSLPSGNRRTRNAMRPMGGTQTQVQIQIDTSPQGGDPGQQRIDGVFDSEVDHPEGEPDRAEQPPYGTLAEAGCDDRANCRVACGDHGSLQPVVVDDPARTEQGQGQQQEAQGRQREGEHTQRPGEPGCAVGSRPTNLSVLFLSQLRHNIPRYLAGIFACFQAHYQFDGVMVGVSRDAHLIDHAFDKENSPTPRSLGILQLGPQVRSPGCQAR